MNGTLPYDAREARLLNRLQDGFPLCAEPFAAVAAELGWTEAEVLSAVERLLAVGVLTRFGPMYHAERLGGELVLAALAVPAERFEQVTELVNAHPEVAHNYEREHELNMWFVIATEEPAGAAAVIRAIEAETGLPVFPMPKEREFFVQLRLEA